MASPRGEERGVRETEVERTVLQNDSDIIVVHVIQNAPHAEAPSREQSVQTPTSPQETNSALTTAQAISEDRPYRQKFIAFLGSLTQSNRSLLCRSLRDESRLYFDNYVCLVLTAAAAVALNVTLIKILSAKVSVFQITAIRSTLCTLVLSVTCFWNGISLIQPRQQVPLFLVRGIFGGFAFLGMALSTWALPLSASAFIANSYPVVTAVMSWSTGMEQLGVLSWVGIAGCLIGNAFVAQPPYLFGSTVEWDAMRIIGIVAAVVSNLFMASTFILIRALMSFPFLIANFPLPLNTRHSLTELLCYGGTSLIGVGLQLVSTRALQIGPPTKVTSLFMMNMLLSGLVGVIALNESFSLISGLGAGITVISVVVITSQKPRKRETTIQRGNSVEASNGTRSMPTTRPV